MDSRLVHPERVRLPLLEDAWIEVKARLNHGETTELYERLYERAPDGELQRHPLRWADALVAAYLVDWSIDPPIRGAGGDERRAALNAIDQDTFLEIKEAVEAHVNALERARAEKKRRRTGDRASSPISASPVAAAGAMSG
jgi:hypothetical protein